jgi:acetyltransferase-like isoleucine patch superfamily enzyme
MKAHSVFWPHLKRVALEEVEPLLSRRILAQIAEGFPAQSFSRARTALLRRAGMKIGNSSLIQGPMHITGEGNPCEQISIGTFTLISGSLHCDIGAPLQIGSRVRIGHDVSLLTVDHRVGPEEMRSGDRKFGTIEIGDGAWLASRVVVLTRDIPPNTLAVGVPARVVRNLSRNGDSEPASDLEAPVSSRRFLCQA